MYPINSLVKIAPSYTTPKFSGVYRIIATPGGNRKSYKIMHVVSGSQVAARDHHLIPFEGSATDAAEIPAMPVTGSIVQYKGGIYVLTGATKTGAQLAELGGGKQYRGVQIKSMTLIPRQNVQISL